MSFNDKVKNFFTQGEFTQLFSKGKLSEVIYPVIRFIRRHKIISALSAVVIVLVSAVLILGNHYLNKINYDDGSNPSVIYTQVAPETLGYSQQNASDNVQLNNDGSYRLADGTIVFKDGAYVNAAGVAVLSDGTTIYKDGLIVFQDGGYINGSGITVSSDGVAMFSDGSSYHISTFLIEKTGSISIKPEYVTQANNILTTDTVNQTTQQYVETTTNKYEAVFGTTTTKKNPSVTNPSTTKKNTTTTKPSKVPTTNPVKDIEDDDEVISSVKKENSEIKDKLEKNDEVIKQNLNDNEIWYHDDIKNILLMGIDSGGKSFPYGRSDAMIIVSINQKTNKVKLISLSRAVYVAIDGYENTRLNHAHGYGGPRLAIKTIEDNYKIRIDNYISTTFSAFQELINAIGGVDIAFSAAEAAALKSSIQAAGLNYIGAGKYKLNGQLALEYVRLRKIDSDRERTARQRKILTSIANKAKSMSVWELNDMLNKVLPYITTDLTKGEIVGQVVNVPSYLSNSFEQHVLPHKSSALTLIGNFEVITVDWKDEVAYTHKLIYGGVTPSYYKR